MANVIEYLPLLLTGLKMTLLLAVCSMIVGLSLGLLLALAKLSPNAWISRPVFAVTNFMRGIPEFLVLLLIYFGGTQVLNDLFPESGFEISPFGAGLLALSLIFAAYASETFRSAFLSVPKGQIEAGRALWLFGLEDVPLHPDAADLAHRAAGAGQSLAGHGEGHGAGVDRRAG